MVKLAKYQRPDGTIGFRGNAPAKLIGSLSTQGGPEGDGWFENRKGTRYKLATVEINGKKVTAMIYEGNVNHPDANFQDGGTYSATVDAVIGEDGKPNGELIISLSHLEQAGRATVKDLGVVFDEVDEMQSAN